MFYFKGVSSTKGITWRKLAGFFSVIKDNLNFLKGSKAAARAQEDHHTVVAPFLGFLHHSVGLGDDFVIFCL